MHVGVPFFCACSGSRHRRWTTLIIAHRFSTLRKADRIVVVEDGHIVGQGTHESLVEGNPTYRRLYRRQWADEGLGRSPTCL